MRRTAHHHPLEEETAMARTSSRIRTALPFAVFGATLAALGGAALASPPSDANGPQGHRPRRPPPFAYEACEGLAEKHACTVQLPDGQQLSGTCTADENAALFCMPEHLPAPPDRPQ
jgi:hypothetical protein